MNVEKSRDLESKYNSVDNYLRKLFDRNNVNAGKVDDLIGAYMDSQRELEECSRRDWPIIKQAQSELCRRIVDLYIEKKCRSAICR